METCNFGPEEWKMDSRNFSMRISQSELGGSITLSFQGRMLAASDLGEIYFGLPGQNASREQCGR